ncbi:lipoyl(octanoyl) transferase LipB [uncultured Amnibacterium sp.]|uniref:lipoyl(octanoyl) transferase LipB n=1 Tax=uncultured Amnibacterium sp. TaxID=1631851 RepID=UPI0035CA514E
MTDVLRDHLAPNTLDYLAGWELQRRIHREVVTGVRRDTLVLCEHDPVFTAGKRTLPAERPTTGAPVIDTDRGGKITWHGPGQLTGYPIVRLVEPHDVLAFVRDLEALMIEVAATFGVAGERVAGRSGVWVRSGATWEKIGAIGLRVKEGVTMHGFALNCDNDLAPYADIVACGIRDAGVTTMTAVAGRRATVEQAADVVAARFDAIVRTAQTAGVRA